ncbi:MAG: hypothetical protein ACYS4T_20010 [Planctomycetota bacterium]|jgi:preprotein translocase subunit SecG
MLSFMREQEFEDSAAQKPLSANDGLPAENTKEPQEQEYISVAAQDKNVRKSTMLLGVLFGIGLICLLFMINKSTRKTATAAVINNDQRQVETAIARLTGVRSQMFNRMDEIVKKFHEFSDVQQINVSELAKNPFKHESDTQEGDSDIDIEMMREQRLRQRAKSMQLVSIMQTGQGNCCMINGKILYEGDSIQGFVVRQISDSFVKLDAEDAESDPKHNEERLGTQIILTLSE